MYNLYQTFTASDFPEKDLSASQKKNLLGKINTANSDQTEAIFMLICEHARVSKDFDYNPEDVHLPYSLEKDGGSVSVDIEKLPIPLRWVLWRFSQIISQPF